MTVSARDGPSIPGACGPWMARAACRDPLLAKVDPLRPLPRIDPDHASYACPPSDSRRTLRHPCSGTDMARPE